jgi:FtsH-binding integral membrane protein
MIQRIQTVWLVLAAICGFLLTRIPLFTARLANQIIKNLLATESLLLFAVSIGTALLAVACIFLFRNRNLQFKLTVVGVILSIALIALEVWKVEEFKKATAVLKGSYYWGALLPMLMMIFFWLAAKGIYKDEKLVKSLNRLR